MLKLISVLIAVSTTIAVFTLGKTLTNFFVQKIYFTGSCDTCVRVTGSFSKDKQNNGVISLVHNGQKIVISPNFQLENFDFEDDRQVECIIDGNNPDSNFPIIYEELDRSYLMIGIFFLISSFGYGLSYMLYKI